jgi:hypothetical protein
VLADAIKAASGRPFSWGEHDCFLWASGVVAAMTGTDPAASVRGRYASRRGAVRVVRELGCSDFLGVFRQLLTGFDEIDPFRARRGDLVAVPQGGDAAMGICNGDVVVAPGSEGLSRVGLDRAITAWRVA